MSIPQLLPLALALAGLAWLALRGESWLGAALRADAGARAGESAGSRIALPLLLALALIALPALGASGLFDRDEGYYAESARGMLERGDPVIPRVAGEDWLEKPPLSYWLMMGSLACFGRNEFAARLPSALAGLAMIALTMRLGRRLLGAFGGLLAGLVLASSLLFALTMRLALLDTVLGVCVLVAMFGLWDLVEGRRGRGFWSFFIGCGLGVLAKGPLGAALPVLALVGCALLLRRWRLLLEARPLRGALVALAVVALWAVPATIRTDGGYLRELVWVRTIQPIFAPLQGHGGGNPLGYLALVPVYVPVLFAGLCAWAPFLVPALRGVQPSALPERARPFLLGWAGMQFLAFSLVSTKLVHYLVPLLPAVALLIAACCLRELRADPSGSTLWTRGRANAAALALALCGALALAAPTALGFADQTAYFAPAGVAAFAGAVALRRAALGGRPLRALVHAAAGVLGSILCLCAIGAPRLDAGKSPRAIAAFLKQHYGAQRLASLPIALCDYRQFSLPFYLDRDVTRTDREGLEAFLANATPVAVVLPEARLLEAEQRGLRAPHEVLWRERCWTPDKNRWETIVVLGNGR